MDRGGIEDLARRQHSAGGGFEVLAAAINIRAGEELTTEGGLDVIAHRRRIAESVADELVDDGFWIVLRLLALKQGLHRSHAGGGSGTAGGQLAWRLRHHTAPKRRIAAICSSAAFSEESWVCSA